MNLIVLCLERWADFRPHVLGSWQQGLNWSFFLFVFVFVRYIFCERQSNVEGKTEKDLPFIGSFPKWSKTAGTEPGHRQELKHCSGVPLRWQGLST